MLLSLKLWIYGVTKLKSNRKADVSQASFVPHLSLMWREAAASCSYLASGAQAWLCLFTGTPLPSCLPVELPARLSIPLLSARGPPSSHRRHPPLSGTRKEESGRMVVTRNLGRSCRDLQRMRKTRFRVKLGGNKKSPCLRKKKPCRLIKSLCSGDVTLTN